MVDLGSPEPVQRAAWEDLKERLSSAARFLWKRHRDVLLLCLILGAGAYFRFLGLNWDQDLHLHPDERFLTMVMVALERPKSLSEYFNSAVSPLNPYNHGYTTFVYGTFPLFLTKYLGGLLHRPGYNEINLVGRALSAFFDLGSVMLIFLIGHRLYGKAVGILAAALTSLCVLHIQLSHFFAVDTFATTFILLAFLAAVLIADQGKWWHFGLWGVALGLAVACKISAAMVVGVGVLACLVRYLRQRGEAEVEERYLRVESLLLRVFSSLVLAFLVFRVAQPYAFEGPGFLDLKLSSHFLKDMRYVRDLMAGRADQPPGFQWTGRTPFLFPWRNMVLWGMGLPLGLAAWAGWAWGWVELARKGRMAHLLPLAWVTFVFLYQGTQFVKSMRYFLPIYPLLALLAAQLLIRLAERGEGWLYGARERLRGLSWGICLAGAVVAGTFGWAWAFSRIYTRPVTRVSASEWVYRNLKPGTVLANEHWDDPLPLPLGGRDGFRIYKGLMLELYADDTPEKLDKLIGELDRADYLILSSNRLYGSIPRLPMRWPMTTEYYRLLFAEELGFRLVKTFTSFPTFFGIPIDDQGAEEAFTVYDHPKVMIFRKTALFAEERVREELERVPLDGVLRLTARQASVAKSGLMLTQEEMEAQRQGGTWTEAFSRRGLANRAPLLCWWLALEALGLIAFLIAFPLWRPLADRGYAFSKALGPLLLAYPVWVLASMRALPYTQVTIWLVLAFLFIGAGLSARRHWRALGAFFRARKRLVLCSELVFSLFFLGFCLVRIGNPDLWHPVTGGEKPMDFAYLNAIIKSTYFPPYDPWFAGGYINYYYFGQVVVATLMKLIGIIPSVAYNLAVASFFALTGLGAFGLTFNLLAVRQRECWGERQALVWGLVGAFFVAGIGNLGQVRLLLQGFSDLGQTDFRSTIPGLAAAAQVLVGLGRFLWQGKGLGFRPEWWYWNASRVIPQTINEFPYFSFLYGDLHAHLLALPYALVAAGLALKLALAGWGGRWRERLRLLGLISLVLGALRATNTWDYPSYLLLTVASLALWYWRRQRGQKGWGWLWPLAGYGVAVVVGSSLLFWPYLSHYATAYAGLALWKGARTGWRDYLVMYGPLLFILASFLATEVYCQRKGRRAPGGAEAKRGRGRVLLVGAFALLAIFAVALRFPLLLLLAPLLAASLWLLARREREAASGFLLLLIAMGLVASLGVELFTLKGDIGRMNTVFKFYLQNWVVWAVGAAVALAVLWRRLSTWHPPWRRIWMVALVTLLAGALLYPPLATVAKVRDRFWRGVGPSLDGAGYMQSAVYYDKGRELPLADDYRAIQWLQDRVSGSPVILEANTPLYRWGSRVSVYTGLPTVIGWDWHQKQQRSVISPEAIENRLRDVQTIYDTEDEALALRLLGKYGVEYIYIGELERAYYQPEGLAKFDRMLSQGLALVYEAGGVKIYRLGKGLPRPAEGPGWNVPLPIVSPSEPVALRDWRWNRLAERHTPLAVLSWWLAIQVLGIAAWPMGSVIFSRLFDRGYLLSKGLGLLLAGYILWLAASLRLVPNTAPVAWVAVGVVAAASWSCYRLWGEGLGRFIRKRWKRLLALELLFSLSYLGMVGVRILNPDLWHPILGGEKPMEFAFLSAILKSAYFPPYDPYFAGAHLNYYYYGQYLVAFLTKLTGIGPRVAFNLAVPWLFALTVGGAFSLGWTLGRRWWVGLGAAFAVAVAGNLDGAVQLGESLFRLLRSGEALAFDYWGSTRLIPHTVNEFPFFSFLFADLHPHMIAMPFALLSLALATVLALDAGGEGVSAPRIGHNWRFWAGRPLLLLALALTLGALAAINTWDFPTYLGLIFIAILIGRYKSCRRVELGGSLLLFLPVPLLSLLLYLPFYLHYRPQGFGLGLVGERSPLGPLLTIWGLFFFLVASLLGGHLVGLRKWQVSLREGLSRGDWTRVVILTVGLVGAAALAIAREWSLGLLLILLAGALLSFGRGQGPRGLFARALVSLGLGLILGCEILHLRDFLSTSEWYRMNTVFKFYIQAWLLLGIGTMVLLPEVWARFRAFKVEFVWLTCLTALLLAVGVYPVFGTQARVNDRFSGRRPPLGTLDGLAFMRYGSFVWSAQGGIRIELAYDLEAIEWLEANTEGLPVLLEAPISYYRAGGLRAASFTGLPTVVGFHENEQRDPNLVYQRELDVRRLYSTADERAALDLMDRYHISYIYVGQLERALYPKEGLAKFDRMVGRFLDVAFENPGVKIYVVRGMV